MRFKEDIIEIGRRLYNRGMVSYHDGNISISDNDKIYATSTMLSKGFMVEDDILIVDRLGKKISGIKEATSELSMHLAIYNANEKIKAIVHAHPITATAFAVKGKAIDMFYTPETGKSLAIIPVAPFAPSGSKELAEIVGRYANDYNGVLLKDHGVVTWAEDIFKAYYLMEQLESYCKMVLILEGMK